MNFQPISDLIGKYKRFQRDTQSLLISEQRSSLGRLFSAYTEYKKTLNEVEKIESPDYNIFQVMGIRYSEVKVHSPIIADLLNPTGMHAQGDLFYKAFINRFFSDSPNIEQYSSDRLRVTCETSTPFGRLDIVVKHFAQPNPYVFIIENKVHAKDQLEQLNRYYDYLQSLSFIKAENKKLLYLTLHGSDPCEWSIHESLYTQLIENGIIMRISYREGIINWIDECISSVKSASVRHTLIQYLKTLKHITNATVR